MAYPPRVKMEPFSPSDMLNNRVDEELEDYTGAFERLAELKEEERQEEAEPDSADDESCPA